MKRASGCRILSARCPIGWSWWTLDWRPGNRPPRRWKGRTRADHEDQREAIKTAVHGLTNAMGGSVSAEHGIGRLKVGDLERYGDPVRLAMMRAIKVALDPQGIMNPGAVLRQGEVAIVKPQPK